ncbi:MAG: hypothetical protein JNM29_09440 [Candidatus Odyssella sp.]|nr:hypothetical protein [Candidatus Odyssella sp.]
MIRSLGCAALALALMSVHAGAETRRAAAGPCAAAAAKPDYGRVLPIPDALRAETEAYRAAWREACAKKKGASLGALLARGDALGKAYTAAIDKSGIKETKYEALHALLGTAYPKFIPAFAGSMIEYEYFEPDLAVFARQAAMGDAEDKLFFASHRLLYGADPHAFPWLKRTTHFGGCVRFGEFDWPGAVARIETLEGKVKAAAYRTRLAELKQRIQTYLSKPAFEREAGRKPVVDSCAPKARTLAEIETIAKALAARKGWEKAAAGLRKAADDIRANRVEVCSGCSAN